MSLKAHKSAPKWVESWCKLHQDSGAKIQIIWHLSKYQKEGLLLAKEQGGSSRWQQSITCLTWQSNKQSNMFQHFPAGMNDIQIFSSPGGLKEKLEGPGLHLIADNGFRGVDNIISHPNSQDSTEVAKFKTRARMRHRSHNGKIKTMQCTDSARFCHQGNL